MDHVRLPVAADDVEESNTESVVASPKSQRGRPRKPYVAAEALACLSLSDEIDEQPERPRAVPSPDITDENLPTYTIVSTQPAAHIQRPRAVLSSPENDELSCELKGEPEKRTNLLNSAPKAPVSPSEGVESSFEPEASMFRTESIQKNSSMPKSFKDPEIIRDTKITTPQGTEIKKISRGIMLEIKDVAAARNGNDENLSNMNGRSRMVKKQSPLPSTTSSIRLKQANKPTGKGNLGRVNRPWY